MVLQIGSQELDRLGIGFDRKYPAAGSQPVPSKHAKQANMAAAVDDGIARPEVEPQESLFAIFEPAFVEESGDLVPGRVGQPPDVRHEDFGLDRPGTRGRSGCCRRLWLDATRNSPVR